MNIQMDPLFLFWLVCVIFSLYMWLSDQRNDE